MKKHGITIIIFLIFAVGMVKAFAENVSVQTAQTAAQSFLNSKMGGNQPIHLIDFAEKAEFPNFYVFGNERCFVIIAADDCVHPVLGYSKENAFGTEGMPENVYGWLKAYNEDVALAMNSNMEASPDIRVEWVSLLNDQGLPPRSRTSVSPLVRTTWNQTTPYNNLCPEDHVNDTSILYNGHTPTGCLATAMAQVMNYWEHPVRGVGSCSYIPHDHPEYGEQYASFGATVYDWDNMKNSYSNEYTEEEANAVATLMYHCGVSVSMNYTPTGSGGNYDTACMALKTYFNFSPNLYIEKKSYILANGNEYIIYTDEEWISMLKDELNLNRPMCYLGGYSLENQSGTHAFVCDGYDEYDMFHFNWGWGGESDGYYAIGALNTGSGSTQQWNQWNAYFCNCFPNTPSINPPTYINTTVNGRSVNIQWNSVNNASSYKLYRDGDLVATNLTNTNYTDSNLIYGTYSYYVKSVKSDGTMSLRSNIATAEVRYPGPVPTNLQATVYNHNVNLSWTAPANGIFVLSYGEGPYVNHCGYGGNHDMYWAQRYPAQVLSDNVAGKAVNKISVYSHINDIPITASIYKGNSSAPDELLYQTSATLDNSGWQDIIITNPVPIDYSSDLWIVLYADSTVVSPAAYCNYSGPGLEDALYLSIDGDYYWRWDENRSWMIKTYATDGTYTYNLYCNSDTVVTNLSNSTYTATNLPDGFYEYHVTTNYFGGESDPSNTVNVIVGNPTYTINVSANPTEGGYVTGGGTYYWGEIATLQAFPGENYVFVAWLEDDSIISTNPVVTITVTGDSHFTACFAIVDSIGDNASSIEVYPNPANDVLYIKGKDIKSVKVINMLGQVVESVNAVQQDDVTIDLSKDEVGIYLLQIKTENGIMTKQFIKQ